MRKYNVLLLYVVEYKGKKFICESWRNNSEYIEVLTRRVFKEKDEIKLEKLSEYYPILAIMNYETKEPLLLSKKDILNKYIDINSGLELQETNELSDDLEKVKETLLELCKKDPEKANQIALEILMKIGAIESSDKIENNDNKLFVDDCSKQNSQIRYSI